MKNTKSFWVKIYEFLEELSRTRARRAQGMWY